jgi:hypothetical protein
MEWDLHFSPIGYLFYSGILKTQTFPNHIYVDASGVLQEVPDEFKAKK